MLVFLDLLHRLNLDLSALVVLVQGTHYVSSCPLMHLAEEPVVLVIIAQANKQIDSQVFDPLPISFVKGLEEVIEAEIVAEHENFPSFGLLDQRLYLTEHLATDAEDAIIAMFVCRGVVAAGFQPVRLALLFFGGTATWVDGCWLDEVRPNLEAYLEWEST